MAIHPKITATVVAGSITGLIIAELNRRGIQIQPDEASDITVLLSALAGWFMPADPSDDMPANGGTVVVQPPVVPVTPVPPPQPVLHPMAQPGTVTITPPPPPMQASPPVVLQPPTVPPGANP